MALQPGFGRSWSMMLCMYGRTTVRTLVGQAAMRQKGGRISAAGVTKEVSFVPVDGAINDRIDDAYKAKYKGSPYVKPMISTRARGATVKVLP